VATINLLERVPSKTKYRIQDLTILLNEITMKYRGCSISKIFPKTCIFFEKCFLKKGNKTLLEEENH